MAEAGIVAGWDRWLFEALNALVGRSWALDTLIALALDDVLVKAGPIGAAFFYAWYARRERRPRPARRRILLVTLASLLLIAPLTKTLSENILSPRPFLVAEQGYALNDGRLAEAPRVRFSTIQTGPMRQRVQAMREGRVDANDLVTFPSDHAAFFIALSLGIFLASRRAGAAALAWTLVVTLGSRVAAGMHWPLDVAAGAAIGAAMLAALQLALWGRRGRPLEPLVRLAGRWPGLTAGLLFLALLEAANVMQTVKVALELAASTAGRLL